MISFTAMRDKLQCGVLLFTLLGGSAVAQQSANAGPSAGAADSSAEAQDVLAFEKGMEAAVVRGDTDYLNGILADDFVMVHGDNWTTGGNPPLTDNKQSFLKRAATKYYAVRDLDSVKVELHGDIAITYGRYIAEVRTVKDPAQAWFSVWFERVYAKRNGKWVYLSHRTVHGPTHGPDRASVSDK